MVWARAQGLELGVIQRVQGGQQGSEAARRRHRRSSIYTDPPDDVGPSGPLVKDSAFARSGTLSNSVSIYTDRGGGVGGGPATGGARRGRGEPNVEVRMGVGVRGPLASLS